MPWLRVGDTAANHPIVLSVLEYHEIDDRLVNEVFGFVMRCALQSTAHLTDYVVNRGTALAIAGFSRAGVLLAAAMHAGYLTEEQRDLDDGQGARLVYKIVEDVEFIHMRTKEEIEWERQRKLDNADPSITIPVRLRDGDACRYCGLVVNWTARKGRLAGTYDHRIPGKRSRGLQDTVVACSSCNGTRSDNTNADETMPLLPVPRKPYFTKGTVDWIANHDWAQRNGFKAPEAAKQTIRPGQPSGTGNGAVPTKGDGGSTPGSTTRATAAPAPAHQASDGTSGSSSQGDGGSTPGPAMSDGSSTTGSPHQGNGVSGPPQAAPAAAPGPPPAPGKASNGKEEAARPAAPHSHLQIPADPSGRRSTGSGNSGSGRVGPGRDGKGTQPRDHHASTSRRRSRPRNRK